MLVFIAACTETTLPPPGTVDFDAGSPADPYGDYDQDGVCNETERGRGTAVDDPDTDGDLFPDLIELSFNYDPLAPAEPDRSRIHYMREQEGAGVQVLMQLMVDGEGRAYSVGLQSQPAYDELGTEAVDFFRGGGGIAAIPAQNAAEVDPNRGFVGVVGSTRLQFDLRFEYEAETIPRFCIHAYPFQFLVKRDDGEIVAREQHLLVILPQSGGLEDSLWCETIEGCL